MSQKTILICHGNDVTAAPPVAPFFTYTGREFDAESGLYNYRARYYDADTGSGGGGPMPYYYP